MLLKFNSFFKQFIWCMPILIVTLFGIYFMNLFDRIHVRNLNRQLEEKHQLVYFIRDLDTQKELVDLVHILDRFDDTALYTFDSSTNKLIEKYHAKNCPFKFKKHPYEDEKIKNKLLTTENGSFVYEVDKNKPMYWDYSWIKVKNKKYLVLAGVTNYNKDLLDKELQISIGFLLLLTALLNWALVGYSKYLLTLRRNLNKKLKSK